MNEEVNFAIQRMNDSFDRLNESSYEAESELEEDGVIQRFEFTYETVWKTLKILLKSKGINAQTPRDVFKEAFKINWIENEDVFLKMLDDRNKTSHIYNRAASREILENIKTFYIPAFKNIMKTISEVFPKASD